MILTKEVTFTIRPIHFKHLRKLGYKNLKVNKKLTIPVKHLSKESHVEIKVKCDVCGKEKMISYRYYNNSINKYNYYSCSSKCSYKKNIKTNLIKYNCVNPSQNKEIKNKKRKTYIKNYGTEYYLQTNEFKEKFKNICMEKYGEKHYSKTNEYKERCKNTCIKNTDLNIHLKIKLLKKK